MRARELREETGLHAAALTRLGTILDHAGFHGRAHPSLSRRGLSQQEAAREHDEVIAEVARFPLRDALAMVQRSDIVDGRPSAGLHLAAAAADGAVKVGLTGFAGSGKTTVFWALTGLRPDPAERRPSIGTIKVPDARVDRLERDLHAAEDDLCRGRLRRLPRRHATHSGSACSTRRR